MDQAAEPADSISEVAPPADAPAEPAPETPDEMLSAVESSLADLWNDLLTRSPFLVAGLAVLLVTWGAAWLASYVVDSLLKRSHAKRGLRDLLRQLTSVGVWVLGLIVAAVIVFPGMTPAKVLAGLGIGSVALGFAFKDIVENFLAGVLILWRFPFDPGDYIVCGDTEGTVMQTEIRMSLLRKTNGELVVLPNAKLFKEPVTVRTFDPVRRVTIIAGVSYDTDVDEARDVIRDSVRKCKSVNKNNPIEIFAQEFASSSVNFEVTWWCGAAPLDERESRDEVVASVKRALDKAGMEIPFPYRTLTFKEPLQINRDAAEENG